MPRPAARPGAPKRPPRRAAKAPARRAPSTQTPPPAPPQPAPKPPASTGFACAHPGLFRPRVRVEKAFKSLHVRITPTEDELYQRARSAPELLDDGAEQLDTTEALRRLAYLGARSIGLVPVSGAAAG